MDSIVLADDALAGVGEACEVRLGLPWIRSLPLWCVEDFEISIDGEPVTVESVFIDGHHLSPDDLAVTSLWWFIQDRLVLRCARRLSPGDHAVEVTLTLVIPYLEVDGMPLRRTFVIARAVSLKRRGEASRALSLRTGTDRENR